MRSLRITGAPRLLERTLSAGGILKRFGITFGGPGADTFPEAINWPKDMPFHTGTKIIAPFAQHDTVRVAIDCIARDASSIPKEVQPRGGGAPRPRHAVLDLFNHPNEDMIGNQLERWTHVAWGLFGETFWYYPGLSLRREGVSAMLRSHLQPVSGELLLLDPRSVIDRDGKWFLRTNGREMELQRQFLTQFKEPNPYSATRGLSRLASLAMEIDADWFAQHWNVNFFKRGATPSGLLKPGVTALVNEEQRKEMLSTWRDRHGSAAHSIGVLPPGWEFEDFGVNQHDAEFISLRRMSQERILSAYHVPKFIAGVGEEQNYSNAREAERVYWRHGVKPRVDDYLATINQDFLPKVGAQDIQLFPAWGAVMALIEDMEKKSEIGRRLFEMGIPLNEINRVLDMGLDMTKVPMSEEGFLPVNLVPVSALNDVFGSTNEAQPQRLPEQQGDEDSTERAVHKLFNPWAEKRRELVWKNIIIRTVDLERLFDKVVRRQLHLLQKEALTNLAGMKGWRLQNVRAKTDSDFFLYDIDRAGIAIAQVTQPVYRSTIERGGESILADLGLGGSFELTNPATISLLAQNASRIKGITETLAGRLKLSLEAGVSAGEGVDALRDRIQHEFGVSLGRSRTIARTEVGAAFNGGRQISMEQNGITMQEWLTSRDADVRDSHAAIDGERVAQGQPFSNGLQYPLDPAGPAEEVANCRCVSLPVIEGKAAA